MRRLWELAIAHKLISATLGFSVFLSAFHCGQYQWLMATPLVGLVTTAGVTYQAADFLATSANRINSFNYHDSGTGTNAAVIGDTALQTSLGLTRVVGTQSLPTAGSYKTVARIQYIGAADVSEWGLFSAPTIGTMWDRRVFTPRSVVFGDAIDYSYTLVPTAGGS
jgi:hypothetical protein